MKKKFFRRFVAVLSAMVTAVTMMATNVSATSNHLNIEVYLDGSFMGRNGVPAAFQTRYPELADSAENMFYTRFRIELDFHFTTSNGHILTTVADNCIGVTDYTSTCSHSSNSGCSNSGPYHHNNGSVIVNTSGVTGTSDSAALIISGRKLCYVSSGTHTGIYGLTWTGSKRLIITENDTTDSSGTTYGTLKTLVHEIGHLYGVEDHYNTYYGDARDYCIWGARKDERNVANSLSMCSTCINTIVANKSKYTHS